MSSVADTRQLPLALVGGSAAIRRRGGCATRASGADNGWRRGRRERDGVAARLAGHGLRVGDGPVGRRQRHGRRSRAARACSAGSGGRRRRRRPATRPRRPAARRRRCTAEQQRRRDRPLARPTGRFSSDPSKAIVVEPPPSSAMPVTAPSRTSVCASSKLVIPTEYPGWRPSTATRMMRPSASWPRPVRGARGESWLVVNASPARNTGAPLRTI